MADLERGQRIKARRVELHLTQPALVDKLEELAYALPDTHALHPAKAGKPPVTLRGVQTWEQGGGIAWEKAKLLAEALQTDVQAMMHGVRPETPDLSQPANPAGADAHEDRLEAIERQLADQAAAIHRIENMLTGRAGSILVSGNILTDQLDRLEQTLANAITQQVGDAAERLEASVAEAQSILRAASQDQRRAAPTRAPKRTPAA